MSTLTVVPDLLAVAPGGEPSSLIDQIVREGARAMLAAALQAEVAAYIDQFTHLRDEDGRRLVVRNGTAQSRDQRWGGGGDRAAGERQAHRPGHRWADAVQLGDLASVGA
jgi:hypothetical protein